MDYGLPIVERVIENSMRCIENSVPAIENSMRCIENSVLVIENSMHRIENPMRCIIFGKAIIAWLMCTG